MSKAEKARKLYEECKDMDIEETMDSGMYSIPSSSMISTA